MSDTVKFLGFATRPSTPFEDLDNPSILSHAGDEEAAVRWLSAVEWQQLDGPAGIDACEVEPGTIMIIHPGSDSNFLMWLNWSLGNSDWLAMIVVSSAPADLLSTFYRWSSEHHHATEGVFVFDYPVYSLKRDQEAVIRARAYSRFAKLLIELSDGSVSNRKEVSAQIVAARDTGLRQQLLSFTEYLIQAVTYVAASKWPDYEIPKLVKVLNISLGLRADNCTLEIRRELFEQKEHAIRQEGGVKLAVPFENERIRINHTLVRNELLNEVQSLKKEKPIPPERRAELAKMIESVAAQARAFTSRAPGGASKDSLHRAADVVLEIRKHIDGGIPEDQRRFHLDFSGAKQLVTSERWPELVAIAEAISETSSKSVSKGVATLVTTVNDTLDTLVETVASDEFDILRVENLVIDLANALAALRPGK